ncbi:MAG: hypothetical protein U1C97_01355 [Candidatus Gracilibacteria bacterium]|nr:hypothetical protein [bacterium]MDZ4216949.1 hypothetical protein [Candidatus Gracilibacteria bacterium]
MQWKELEGIIHDHSKALKSEQVEEISSELLKDLGNGDKPLQAAKIAYVLALLQLRTQFPNAEKCLQFIQHLKTILDHEVQDAELSESEHSLAHLVYVRKLAEHYYHHLMMLAEGHQEGKIVAELKTLRRKNHIQLLKLQTSSNPFWRQERNVIRKAMRSHYLFTALIFSIALFFAWDTFWSLMDYGMAQMIYSEYPVEAVSTIVQKVLLLLFSLSFVWGFVSYQRGHSTEEAA